MKALIRYFWSLVQYQFGLKALSVIIAFTLWVVVFGSRTMEITKEVPFEITLSDDQIVSDPIPEKVAFRLTGPKAFLRSITSRIEDPIRANIKDFKSGVFTYKVFSDSIKLPIGVKVQAITPNVIQFRVEQLRRKTVSAKLETVGESVPGYRLIRAEVLPPTLKIKGPKDRIENLTVLPSLPVDIGSLKETTILPLAFDFKSLGIEPDSSLPELNAEIQARGQAFRVKNVPLMIRTTGKAKTDEETVTVIVRTDLGEVIKVDGDQVHAEIDVRDMPDGEFLKWIRVQLPPKVHLIRVIPPLARVVVKGQ